MNLLAFIIKMIQIWPKLKFHSMHDTTLAEAFAWISITLALVEKKPKRKHLCKETYSAFTNFTESFSLNSPETTAQMVNLW